MLEASLVLFGLFFFLLFIGIPISIGISLSSLVTLLTLLPADTAIIVSAQKVVVGIDSFALLAIPFFIMSGSIMSKGGLAFKLVNFVKVVIGNKPGSLYNINTFGNMLFGSVSGSAVASAVAVGGVISDLQRKEGYDMDLAAAVNVNSSPMGMLIPPSNALILYSLVSGGTSVSALFLAGYVPGILWGIAMVLVTKFLLRKQQLSDVVHKSSMVDISKAFIDALPTLLLVFIVIGGIVFGVFTATEGAAIAVVYPFVLCQFIYKTLKKEDWLAIFKDTITMSGIVLFLVGSSSVMSWAMAFAELPNFITMVLTSISTDKYLILLIINCLLLVIGTFMDITPAILIFTPILLPIVTSLGVDPVHFGIMMVFNLCIGICTPPVGSALFVGCSVGKVGIEGVIKKSLPYFAVIIFTLMLVTYFPVLSTGLPKMFGLMK